MTADDVLARAIELIRAGNKAEARQLLEPYIQANPQHVAAWLWEARAHCSNESRIQVLEQCHDFVAHGRLY